MADNQCHSEWVPLTVGESMVRISLKSPVKKHNSGIFRMRSRYFSSVINYLELGANTIGQDHIFILLNSLQVDCRNYRLIDRCLMMHHNLGPNWTSYVQSISQCLPVFVPQAPLYSTTNFRDELLANRYLWFCLGIHQDGFPDELFYMVPRIGVLLGETLDRFFHLNPSGCSCLCAFCQSNDTVWQIVLHGLVDKPTRLMTAGCKGAFLFLGGPRKTLKIYPVPRDTTCIHLSCA